jgi:hypothetical protein
MQRLLGIVFIFTLLLTSVGLAGAQEPPINTPADNACNEGGAMAGKCGNSEWAWTCGWHLARWLTRGGWGGTYAMPDTCAILLPPRPPVSVAGSTDSTTAAFVDNTRITGCVLINPGTYASLTNALSIPAGTQVFSDASCSVGAGILGTNFVYDPSPLGSNADALCLAEFSLPRSIGAGPNFHLCYN